MGSNAELSPLSQALVSLCGQVIQDQRVRVNFEPLVSLCIQRNWATTNKPLGSRRRGRRGPVGRLAHEPAPAENLEGFYYASCVQPGDAKRSLDRLIRARQACGSRRPGAIWACSPLAICRNTTLILDVRVAVVSSSQPSSFFFVFVFLSSVPVSVFLFFLFFLARLARLTRLAGRQAAWPPVPGEVLKRNANVCPCSKSGAFWRMHELSICISRSMGWQKVGCT